jgi:hypothetical protein
MKNIIDQGYLVILFKGKENENELIIEQKKAKEQE